MRNQQLTEHFMFTFGVAKKTTLVTLPDCGLFMVNKAIDYPHRNDWNFCTLDQVAN